MAAGKRKSCVLIVENLPLPFDRRVWQEAQALHTDGWQVSAICPKTEKFPESYICIDGVHIYRHPLPLEASGKLGFFLEYACALFHEFRLLVKIYFRHGFDVIQACNPPDLIFLPVLPFKLLGKKFVFDHHDICPELFAVKFNRKGLLYKTLLFFEKMSYRCADFVITANDAFRELCAGRTGKNPENVIAVYSVPGANLRRGVSRADLRNGKRIVLGYVGIIGNQDGVDHLVRALAHLKNSEEMKDIGALIVGDGPDLPAVKSLAADLGVQNDIIFTGFLSGEEFFSAISTFDIGIIPDPYNEYNDKISMNKVFEYSKLGLPVVSYPLSETVRLLNDALEVAPGHTPEDLATAIAALANDVERRKDKAARSTRRAESFSWEQEKEKYLNIFNRLIK